MKARSTSTVKLPSYCSIEEVGKLTESIRRPFWILTPVYLRSYRWR
jgi:hypothetical protein